MKELTKHPLYTMADIVKRAFLTNGFELYDDCQSPEIISVEKAVDCFEIKEEFNLKPVLLEKGKYTLRTNLLVSELTKFKGTLPINKIICGKVYDGKDVEFPAHLHIEGIMAHKAKVHKDIVKIWTDIAVNVYGIDAVVNLEAYEKDCYEVVVTKSDNSKITFALTGKGRWITKALLGTEDANIDTWVFAIDVDSLAMDKFNLETRSVLYDNRVSYLASNKDNTPYVGDNIINKAGNLLRNMGYNQYFGTKVYPDNIYKKMNMIQESWDSNNAGVALVEPLGDNTGLPTVLTPSVEQALADNWNAGEKEVKIFEIGHIFLPDKTGGAPKEKITISVGAYGEEVNSQSFKATIDEFLTKLGIKNHFFFPTNMAIAYDTKDTWLMLDEKMKYLDGNFGGISAKAEANFGIGTHAFMANMEIEALENKVNEEYYFIPGELL